MKIIEKGDRILLISPHPDDVEFGCGGTIYQFRQDITTKLLVLSNRFRTRGETENEKEQKSAASILGINDIQFENFPIRFFSSSENRDKIRLLVTKVCEEFKPDLIFIPALNETMQDHSSLAEEVIRVIRNISIIGYEVIKHNRYFRPNVFITISKESLLKKIEAISCYKGQSSKSYFDKEIIESLAITRASALGTKGYAEAFEIYNLVQKT